MLRRKVFWHPPHDSADENRARTKGPAQSRENTERGRAPREISQGATFRYALSMPNRHQGAKGPAPRARRGPTTAFCWGWIRHRLGPNDAATCSVAMNWDRPLGSAAPPNRPLVPLASSPPQSPQASSHRSRLTDFFPLRPPAAPDHPPPSLLLGSSTAEAYRRRNLAFWLTVVINAPTNIVIDNPRRTSPAANSGDTV